MDPATGEHCDRSSGGTTGLAGTRLTARFPAAAHPQPGLGRLGASTGGGLSLQPGPSGRLASAGESRCLSAPPPCLYVLGSSLATSARCRVAPAAALGCRAGSAGCRVLTLEDEGRGRGDQVEAVGRETRTEAHALGKTVFKAVGTPLDKEGRSKVTVFLAIEIHRTPNSNRSEQGRMWWLLSLGTKQNLLTGYLRGLRWRQARSSPVGSVGMCAVTTPAGDSGAVERAPGGAVSAEEGAWLPGTLLKQVVGARDLGGCSLPWKIRPRWPGH